MPQIQITVMIIILVRLVLCPIFIDLIALRLTTVPYPISPLAARNYCPYVPFYAAPPPPLHDWGYSWSNYYRDALRRTKTQWFLLISINKLAYCFRESVHRHSQ